MRTVAMKAGVSLMLAGCAVCEPDLAAETILGPGEAPRERCTLRKDDNGGVVAASLILALIAIAAANSGSNGGYTPPAP